MNVVPRIFVGARRKGRFAPFARKSRRVPRIFWPIRQDLSLPPVRRFALPYGRSIIAEQYRFWFSSTTTPTQSFRKAPPRSLSVNRSSGEDRGGGGGKLHHARRLRIETFRSETDVLPGPGIGRACLLYFKVHFVSLGYTYTRVYVRRMSGTWIICNGRNAQDIDIVIIFSGRGEAFRPAVLDRTRSV